MNLLLINADQLRHDCVGYAGIRPVRTPHLDALARVPPRLRAPTGVRARPPGDPVRTASGLLRRAVEL